MLVPPWTGARLAALTAPALLGGCLQLEPGLSGRDAEIGRQRGEAGFAFVETGPERAVVRAGEDYLALVPVEGLCLTGGSFTATDGGAFAVVADCVTERVSAAPEGAERLELPPAFPGIVTVAISGEGAEGAQGDAAIDRLRGFLSRPVGLAMLGRDGESGAVEVVAIEPAESALFVHVRDTSEGGLALLSPEFWRGFVDVKGRLVLVTVSGFRDRPLPSDEMRRLLGAQVARIRTANAGAVTLSPGLRARAEEAAPERPEIAAARETAEAEIARAVAEDAVARGGTPPEGPGRSVDTGSALAPRAAPPPPPRRVAAAPGGSASPAAPRSAPPAPARPAEG